MVPKRALRLASDSSGDNSVMGAGTSFLGATLFVGSYDHRSTDAQNGGQSTYNGSMAVTLIDRALVANVLPGDFSLAARTDGGQEHPIIVCVGHQRNLMYLTAGVLTPADPDYQEMILLVPFVVRASGTKWHTFVVRMYLDDINAIGIGNSIYAYQKQPAQLQESGTPDDLTTRVTPFLSDLIFNSYVRITGPWCTSSEARISLPDWTDIQTIVDMPIVGADVSAGNIVRTVCSYWEWEYSNAEVAPASSQHQFFRPFRDGMGAWVALGPLTSIACGGFAIRGIRWRLALPPPSCQF
jgi:hypothetical protein